LSAISMPASCVLSASRGLACVPLDVSEVEMASSSLDSSSVFAIVGPPNGAGQPWLSVLSSPALFVCASLVMSLNWSSRLIRRIKLVAAVAPEVEFSIARISDVRSSPRRRRVHLLAEGYTHIVDLAPLCRICRSAGDTGEASKKPLDKGVD